MLGNRPLVTAVLQDYRTAPISDREKALFAFIFYNKWIDATGVSDMPAAAYAVSGERLATFGYVPPEPPDPSVP